MDSGGSRPRAISAAGPVRTSPRSILTPVVPPTLRSRPPSSNETFRASPRAGLAGAGIAGTTGFRDPTFRPVDRLAWQTPTHDGAWWGGNRPFWCAPSNHWNSCGSWNSCGWNSCGSGWNFSIGFSTGWCWPSSCWSSSWCWPSHCSWYRPYYSSSWCWPYWNSWCWDPYPCYNTYCGDYGSTWIYTAPVTHVVYDSSVASDTIVDINLPPFHPTVYRSDEIAGVLDWKDSPESIVAAVHGAPVDLREVRAADYLGRVPAGGWRAIFDREEVAGDQHSLFFRNDQDGAKSARVLIVLRPRQGVGIPPFEPGQQAFLTGRLAEICVDNPYEQAGILTLEDGSVKR